MFMIDSKRLAALCDALFGADTEQNAISAKLSFGMSRSGPCEVIPVATEVRDKETGASRGRIIVIRMEYGDADQRAYLALQPKQAAELVTLLMAAVGSLIPEGNL